MHARETTCFDPDASSQSLFLSKRISDRLLGLQADRSAHGITLFGTTIWERRDWRDTGRDFM